MLANNILLIMRKERDFMTAYESISHLPISDLSSTKLKAQRRFIVLSICVRDSVIRYIGRKVDRVQLSSFPPLDQDKCAKIIQNYFKYVLGI
jgi:hypothetical protein